MVGMTALLPSDIVEYILDMADIDTRIRMHRQKRMDKTRLQIPGIRHPLGVETDVLEMSLYLPLPGRTKQYVYWVCMQEPRQVWEQLMMIDFRSIHNCHVLYDQIHPIRYG